MLPWPALLALRPMPVIPPHAPSVFIWGDARVHGIALRTAALAVAKGLPVAVLDAEMALQVRPFVAMARACRVAPESFLQRIHVARAFTGWQLTTLVCDRLEPLLTEHPMSLVIFLGPLTLFCDEDVTDKAAKVLFHRRLHSLASLRPDGPQVLLAQTVPASSTPRRRFARDLLHAVDVGLRLLPGEERWSAEVVKAKFP
jgi:hypothetical protein